MMDYCVMESTRTHDDEVCEHEMTTTEILKEITRELTETVNVLSQMKVYLDGKAINERKQDQPKCFHDEVKLIEHMSADCMGLSHEIYAEMFGPLDRPFS